MHEGEDSDTCIFKRETWLFIYLFINQLISYLLTFFFFWGGECLAPFISQIYLFLTLL